MSKISRNSLLAAINKIFSRPKKLIIGLYLFLYAFYDHSQISDTSDIAVLVFTKDRPVQLEALLRSSSKYFKGNYTFYILWNASSNLFSTAYHDVFSAFASEHFQFYRETDFRRDLHLILNGSKHHGVMFMVDDLVFIDYFDAASLIGLDPLVEIASLRLWPGNSYCQPRMLHSPPPSLDTSSTTSWIQFSWIESLGDWSMPISLDGHLFSRSEILRLIRYLDFKAPNSLEKALGDFRFLFKHRKGLCKSMPSIRNFAFNRVQIENEDFPCGLWSPDRLLEKWLDGWQIDIKKLAELDAQSCHVVVEPVFERRPFTKFNC